MGSRGGEGGAELGPPRSAHPLHGQEVGGGSPISERARGIGTCSGCTPLMVSTPKPGRVEDWGGAGSPGDGGQVGGVRIREPEWGWGRWEGKGSLECLGG